MTNYILSRFFHFRFSKICFSAFLCFSLCDFAFSNDVPADLAAYKEQVVSLASTFAGTASDLARSVQQINSACAMILLLTEDHNIIDEVQRIQPVANSISGRAASLRDTAIDIADVASLLTSSSSSSNALCSCSEQLSVISNQLEVIMNDWQWLNDELAKPYDAEGSTFFESIANLINENTAIWDIDFLQQDGRDSYYPLLMFQGLSSISNSLFSYSGRSSASIPRFVIHYRSGTTANTGWKTQTTNPFAVWDDINSYSLLETVHKFAGMNLQLLASLNLCARTNEFAFASIARSSFGVLFSVTNIEERFSIFNDFVFSADAPLSMYTDKQTDGSYHDYLTNYYIKVSKGQQSGSDSFTNWFSRVELLLAALVFQDEDDSTINTNGVPSESDKNSVTEIGSSLDQTISGFVQDGSSHVSVVDTSGKSILRMISSWNTSIGQTAKPAPFVVAEFTSPDSQSRSNISLYLDTEDERLSSLIEIGHGISTLAWVSLFLLLGYNLAVYSIRALRKLISLSFSLYSAIFGGG